MQLYARVFLQILDSSIAEDFTTRHVFEDLLKLSDDGIVDMTRPALARRINCPMEVLNQCLAKLEAPDPQSRDKEFEGRRIEKLDEHRDWGWKILNWEKYEAIRTRAQNYERVIRHRKNKGKPHSAAPPKSAFVPPTLEEVKFYCTKIGLPESEAVRFIGYYESNGWRVSKNPMKSWRGSMITWKANWEERRNDANRNTGRPLTGAEERRKFAAKSTTDYTPKNELENPALWGEQSEVSK